MHCPSVSKSNCPENFYPAKIVVDRYSAKPRLNEIETFSNCLYKYHPEILWSLGYFAKTRHQTKNICFKESWSCWRSHNGRFWFCQSWWRWAKSARADVGQTALDTKKWSHIYNTSKRESRQEFFQTSKFKPHAIHPTCFLVIGFFAAGILAIIGVFCHCAKLLSGFFPAPFWSVYYVSPGCCRVYDWLWIGLDALSLSLKVKLSRKFLPSKNCGW